MSPEQLAEHVRAMVDAAPPLSDAQRERLAALLRPVARPADRAADAA